MVGIFGRPHGTSLFFAACPAINRWATISCSFGAGLAISKERLVAVGQGTYFQIFSKT